MKHCLAFILLLIFLSYYVDLNAQHQALVDSSAHSKSLYEKLMKDKARDFDSHINFQFCSSFQTSFINHELDEASFKLNRLRLEMQGSLFQHFSYHFRYSFNHYRNPNTIDNLSSHVELACLGWNITDKFSLTAGKQFLALGGYEYYVNAIKVRHFTDFNCYQPCYLTGAMFTYSPNENQAFNFQVVNNRVEEEQLDFYAYPPETKLVKVPLLGNIGWTGSFCDKSLQFYYGAAAGQIMKGKKVGYLAFGNVWERGPILAYLDCMYSREELDSKGLITNIQQMDNDELKPVAQDVQYLTWIGNVDYRVHPHINMYVKGAYELGGVYKANNQFQEGWLRKVWNAQFCVEYYPLLEFDFKVYLHLLYKQTNFSSAARQIGGKNFSNQQIMLGIVYNIPVI